ncbi:MAG TPA: adenosine kinase [Acidimicrobiales bacterium]|nr:adenosine kinase [Acidimicrobiales bacterium]
MDPTPATAAASLDVVGVGNAIVDVIAQAEEAFLDAHGLVKGSMALVDTARSAALYDAMGPAVEVSGGSAANTLAGLASLGGTGGFIGRVHADQLGEVFAHDIRSLGVAFPVPPATDGSPTGRCLIVVTPDGERTMSTLLGAAGELGPDDVDEALLASASVTYLEGYLFDKGPAREAFARAAAVAHAAGREVALTLSDSFCVERARSAFRQLVVDEIDVLFANAAEIRLLYETDDLEAAIGQAADTCRTVVVTRSAEGSTVIVGGERHDIEADPVAKVVDTTGAGDLYAAGFLYGHTRGMEPQRCGRLGSMAAAEVISHLGARPVADLADLAAPLLG